MIFPDRIIDSTFKIWHSDNSVLERSNSLNSEYALTAALFPTEFNRAIVKYANGKAGYFDLTGQYREVKKKEFITTIAPVYYDSFKYKILLADTNRNIEIWNLYGSPRVDSTIDKRVSYKFPSTIKINNYIISIAISRDRSKIFAVDEKGMGAIWNTDKNSISLNPVVVFNVLQDTVSCSIFSNDGSMIATGARNNSIRIWDASNGNLIKVLNGHTGPITSVAFSAKDSFLYSGSMDKTFRQWRVPKTMPKSSVPPTAPIQWNLVKSFNDLFDKKIIDTLKPQNR